MQAFTYNTIFLFIYLFIFFFFSENTSRHVLLMEK